MGKNFSTNSNELLTSNRRSNWKTRVRLGQQLPSLVRSRGFRGQKLVLQPLSVELTARALSVHSAALCTFAVFGSQLHLLVPTNDPAIKLGAGALGPQ